MAWGIVYVIHNSKMGNDLFKVGKTTRDIESRLLELNGSTTNLGTFEVVATFPCYDADQAEILCHSALATFREQTNREFFRGNANQIYEICRNICEQFVGKPTTNPNFLHFENSAKAAVRSISFRDKLSKANARKYEADSKRLLRTDELSERVRILTSEVRARFARLRLEIDPEARLQLKTPDGLPDVLELVSPWIRSELDQSKKKLTPIVECRVYFRCAPSVIRLGGLNYGEVETEITDDGRWFDLIICPTVLNADIRKHLLEYEGYVVPSDGVALALFGDEFRYSSTWSHLMRNGPQTYHYQREPVDAGIYTDANSCVERFVAILASSVAATPDTLSRRELHERNFDWLNTSPHSGLEE